MGPNNSQMPLIAKVMAISMGHHKDALLRDRRHAAVAYANQGVKDATGLILLR
jgi:hypothetical protein